MSNETNCEWKPKRITEAPWFVPLWGETPPGRNDHCSTTSLPNIPNNWYRMRLDKVVNLMWHQVTPSRFYPGYTPLPLSPVIFLWVRTATDVDSSVCVGQDLFYHCVSGVWEPLTSDTETPIVSLPVVVDRYSNVSPFPCSSICVSWPPDDGFPYTSSVKTECERFRDKGVNILSL